MDAGMIPCLQYGNEILQITVSGTLGPHQMTVRGTLGLQAGSRCMETTIRSVISSPSASGNNPWIAYIWMYVSWDIYRDTYLDIWVRRVIIIIDNCYGSYYDSRYSSYVSSYDSQYPCYVFLFDYRMICNSDSIRLDLCGMRQKYICEGFLV